MTGIRVIRVVSDDHSATKNLGAASFNEDDIARFDVVGKLPHGVCRVFLRGFAAAHLLESKSHIFFGRILAQIPELVPTEAHDATAVEVFPHACALAGCVEPVMDDFDPRVAKCVLLLFLFGGLGGRFSLFVDSFRLGKRCIGE